MNTTESLFDGLRDLSLGVQAAWHEAQADPERAEEIFSRLTAEVRRLTGTTAMHLRAAQAAVEARDNAVERATVAAERRICVGLSGIAAAGIGDDFDPRGFFVYCLWGAATDKPLYVGLSRNVLSRLGSHLQNPRRRYGIHRVTLIKCKTVRQMESTEARLIRHYQPEWNVLGIIPQEVVA